MSAGPALDVDLVAVDTAGEVAVILAVTARGVARAVRLAIRPAAVVPEFTLWNELPVSGLDDGISAELADFRPGERRRILLGFQVAGSQAVAGEPICEFELRWFEPASGFERIATVPVAGHARKYVVTEESVRRARRAPCSPRSRPGPRATR